MTSPVPYPAYGSDEVLVMEYIEGVQINDVDRLRIQGDDPAELGRRLAENYVTQFIDNGFFHADPHPGNILVRDHDIVWIDLGTVSYTHLDVYKRQEYVRRSPCERVLVVRRAKAGIR